MRNVTTQQRLEKLTDQSIERLPPEHREGVRDVSIALAKELAKAATTADDLDDITLAKFLVRTGYTLGALHYADIDLLIRQDLAREAEARGE